MTRCSIQFISKTISKTNLFSWISFLLHNKNQIIYRRYRCTVKRAEWNCFQNGLESCTAYSCRLRERWLRSWRFCRTNEVNTKNSDSATSAPDQLSRHPDMKIYNKTRKNRFPLFIVWSLSLAHICSKSLWVN